MLARFSGKLKLVALVVAVVAFAIHYFVSTSQEVGRLTDQLERGDVDAKLRALAELGDMGYRGSGAAEELMKAQRNSDSQVRYAATEALVRIDRDLAVKGLIEALQARDRAVRLDAADYLERIGSARARAALETIDTRAEENHSRSSLKDVSRMILKDKKREQHKKFREHLATYGD